MSKPSEWGGHEAFYFFEKHGQHRNEIPKADCIAAVPMKESVLDDLAKRFNDTQFNARLAAIREVKTWAEQMQAAAKKHNSNAYMGALSDLLAKLAEMERG